MNSYQLFYDTMTSHVFIRKMNPVEKRQWTVKDKTVANSECIQSAKRVCCPDVQDRRLGRRFQSKATPQLTGGTFLYNEH